MLNFRNKLIIISFAIYFIIGAYLSATNGISHDQYHEQLNWKINFEAIKGVLINNDNGYEKLFNYKDKYHGIAFHYFSQPIQLLSNNIIGEINNVNYEYSHLAIRNAKDFRNGLAQYSLLDFPKLSLFRVLLLDGLRVLDFTALCELGLVNRSYALAIFCKEVL